MAENNNHNPPEPSQTEDKTVSEASHPEKEPISGSLQPEIPIEQLGVTSEVDKIDQPKRDLPKIPVELLKLTKSGGITLPKSIREQLEEKQAFAFWLENDRYLLMPVKEYEIPDLKLAADIQKEKKRRAAVLARMDGSGTKTKRKPRSSSKSKAKNASGPQPELSKYFPYSIENQEKLQDGIEASFYKLLEVPPKIDEVIERIKYMIINYGNGKKTNDSRLKHTIILFALDAVEKIRDHDLTPLLQFLDERIVELIDSAYLYEQSLIFLCGTSLNIENNQFSYSFLQKIFKVIDNYKENFTIMQGLKSITKTVIQKDKPLTELFQIYLRNNLKKYVVGPEVVEISDDIEENDVNEESGIIGDSEPIKENDFYFPLSTDSSLEIVELLENLQMYDAAYDAAKYLLERIPVEDVHIERVRAKVNALAKK
ncbi:MAG: AbrB/MazE/SpoVT family DNA-binding domain-containing protein [Promethearchaeota archaeon]